MAYMAYISYMVYMAYIAYRLRPGKSPNIFANNNFLDEKFLPKSVKLKLQLIKTKAKFSRKTFVK